MRLLDLKEADDGLHAVQHTLHREPQVHPVIREQAIRQPLPGQAAANARVLPINSRPVIPSRRPVELVRLQHRIDELEKRIQQRIARQADAARREDLEKLGIRMKALERRVDNELWAARQREHYLLELLARPSLAVRVKLGAQQLWKTAPPLIWAGCKSCGAALWEDAQPLWWPRFAAAWQQAWDKARS